jgi:hypothetical protein
VFDEADEDDVTTVPDSGVSSDAQSGTGSSRTEFSWKRGRLYSFPITEVFFDICVQANLARVTSVTKKPTSKWRPVALETVSFSIPNCN